MMGWSSEVAAAVRAHHEAAEQPQNETDQSHGGGDGSGDGALAERYRWGAGLPLNDYGNGQRVKLYFGEDLMFVPRLAWFRWDGHKWAPDEDGLAVRRLAHKIQDNMRREAFAIEMSKGDQAIVDAGDDARPLLRDLEEVPRDELTQGQKLEKARLQTLITNANTVRENFKGRRDRHLRSAKSSGNSGPVKNMLHEVQPYVARDITELNAAPLSINTAECVLDLVEIPRDDPDAPRRYEVVRRDQDRADLMTKGMDVVFDPAAKCPEFIRFLEFILPDASVRAFMQRWLGYSMTGLTHEQKLVFLYGTGRNGKSTLVDLIAKMLSAYATSVPIESLTGVDARKGADATPDLVRLPGARMVRAAEPESGTRFREALIKQLTGGEPIMVRKMREEFVEVEPEFKLTISGNHKPEIHGGDEGIWRRILLVPFEAQVPKADVDPMLPQKLWAERSGILNWLLAGAVDFLQGGLREPDSVVDATANFREDSDPMAAFMKSWCRVTGAQDDFESTKDLVDAFNLYQTENGGSPFRPRTVQLRLKEKVGVKIGDHAIWFEHRSVGNGYGGIALRTDVKDVLPDFRAGREVVLRDDQVPKAPVDLGEDFV